VEGAGLAELGQPGEAGPAQEAFRELRSSIPGACLLSGLYACGWSFPWRVKQLT